MDDNNEGSTARAMRQPDGVVTYLPENLNLTGMLPRKWHDYAAWFVGGLYLRRHTEKYGDPEGFRRVSSVVLKTVLPKRDYKDIVDALIAARVIERDGSYQYHRSSAGMVYGLPSD